MTLAIEETALVVDAPGLYDMTDEVYHGDPVPAGSLSSSGTKDLLPPSCPAIYRYKRDHRDELHKRAFDFGHAAHLEILGVGAEVEVVDERDWKKKTAQEAQKAAYAAGKVPLLTREAEQVKAMGRALRADPVASALFNPDHGVAEQSMFWVDAEFGVWRRIRIDWLKMQPGRRPLVVDYKSTTALDDRSIAKAVHNWSYHQQQPFYLDGVKALNVADDPAFLFAFQLKTPPYLVRVVQLDAEAVKLGRERNLRALELFRDCQASGVWPAYSSEITQISLPRYAEWQWADEQDQED